MIILAAGLSKRMGVFKPLMPVGRHPAILRNIHTAEAAGVFDIVVVTGYMHEALKNVLHAHKPDLRLIHNSRYREDMILSVRSGVSALAEDTDGFFLLPADCCAISKYTLSSLINAFKEINASVVTHPEFEGKRGHPPLIPAKYIDRIVSDDSANGLKGILDSLPAIEIDTNDPGVLLDMDTPEDYALLLTHLGLPAP